MVSVLEVQRMDNKMQIYKNPEFGFVRNCGD